MITLESTVDEVDIDTFQTKLTARNSLQVSETNSDKSKSYNLL